MLPSERAELTLGAGQAEHQDLDYIVLVEIASAVGPPAHRFGAAFNAAKERFGLSHPGRLLYPSTTST